MMPKVKICGLTRAEDVACAIEAGADYLGFIVEAASKRRLSVAQAAKLAAPARGIIPRVAVTVNADDDLLAQIMEQMVPDFIQCHGDEDFLRVAEIAGNFNVKTIKACAIENDMDMIEAGTFGVADILLLDAKPPKGENVRGGHGISFDWNILKRAALPKYWALAGGLTPQSVAQALAQTKAPMVDVSSGVEARAGVKDHAKIRAFMAALR